MWDLKACRCCLLTTGSLTRLTDIHKKMLLQITDLEIKPGDGYPTHICFDCGVYLRKMIQFRRRCKRAYFILREIMNVKKQVTLRELNSVDRKLSNLVSKTQLSRNEINIIEIPLQYIEPNTPILSREDLGESQYSLQTEIFNSNDATVNTDSNDTNAVNKNSTIIDTEKEYIDVYDDDTNNFDDDDTVMEGDDYVGEDIDMEDIFKGMKEDEDFCVESEEEESVPHENERKKTKELTKRSKNKEKAERKHEVDKLLESYEKFYGVTRNVRKVIPVLINANIKLLTYEEQVDVHLLRTLDPVYLKATYKCGLCVEQIETLDLLKGHVHIHNRGLQFPYRCSICKLQCEDEEKLKMHCANIHWYSYTCKTCHQTSYSVEELLSCNEQHGTPVRQYEYKKRRQSLMAEMYDKFLMTPKEARSKPPHYLGKRSNHKCEHCKVYLPLRSYLNVHNKNHKKEPKHKGQLQCDLCQSYFKNKTVLAEHFLNFHTYRFECKICGTAVFNITQAEIHLSSHDKLSCKLCPHRQILSAREYERHLLFKHPHILKKLDCNVCGSRFKDMFDLYQHQYQTHKYLSIIDPQVGDPEFKCQKCDGNFLNKLALNRHLVKSKHADVESIEAACNVCMEAFESKELFDSHICRVKKYPTKCKNCNTELNDRQADNLHQQTCETLPFSTKKVPRKYLCDLCGNVFSSGSAYSKHRKNHSRHNINQYQCSYCNMKLFKSNIFVEHILRSHTHKPYMCALCNARYEYKKECRDHILRTHAPAKPYNCDFCNRSFSHPKYLSVHAKKIHNVQVDMSKYHIRKPQPNDATDSFELYPFMKIDATHVPIDVFNNVEMLSTDFLGENPKRIDNYEDILVMDAVFAPVDKKNLSKKMRTTDKKYVKNKPASKKNEISSEIKFGINETQVAVDNIKMDDESEIIDVKTDLYEEHFEGDCILEEFEDLKYENNEETAEEGLTVEEIQDEITKGNYETIDHEGETCILINGVVYKVEES